MDIDTDYAKQIIWMLYFNWQNKKPLEQIDWQISYNSPQTKIYYFIDKLIKNSGSTWILNVEHDYLKPFVEKWSTK